MFGWLKRIFTPVPIKEPEPLDRSFCSIYWLNQERIKKNRKPFEVDARALLAATTWANQMARVQKESHNDFDDRMERMFGSNVATAENVGRGQTDAAGIVASWMKSPPHRSNILDDYSHVGLSAARAADGTLYWCAVFVKFFE